MGTTGASMLLIRPLIRANDNRAHKAHVVVFFIFIVSNAGGSLTPLGDPPLFLGFLKGVDFFWTVQPHLSGNAVSDRQRCWPFSMPSTRGFTTAAKSCMPLDPTPDTRRIGFDGAANFWLLAAVVALVLLSGIWKSAVVFNIAGTDVGLPGLVRDVGLVAVTLLSLKHHAGQGACRQPVLLGADAGSGQAVRRHFPDHHPGDRHAQGRRQRPVRRGGVQP